MPIQRRLLQSVDQTADGLKNFTAPGKLLVAGQFVKTHFLVKDRDLLDPPGSPTAGDHYLLPSSGALLNGWSAFTNGSVVAFTSGAWLEISAFEGMTVDVLDEDVSLRHDGSAWSRVSGVGLLTVVASQTIASAADYTLIADMTTSGKRWDIIAFDLADPEMNAACTVFGDASDPVVDITQEVFGNLTFEISTNALVLANDSGSSSDYYIEIQERG